MWRYGGVYHDMDVEAFAPVFAWAPDRACNLVLHGEGFKRQIAQYVFAASPRHPLLASMLADIEMLMMQHRVPMHPTDEDVVNFAGPPRFTAHVFKWLDKACGLSAPKQVLACVREDCPAREQWLHAHRAALQACGVCFTDFRRSWGLLVNHSCAANGWYCAEAQGGSWRAQTKQATYA